MTSTAVRPTDPNAPYRPQNRAQEWILALTVIVVFFAIIEAVIYALSRFRL